MQMVVLGMHRSGTSAVARLLNMMGAYFSPEYGGADAYALPPTTANPKGYWERKDVMKLNDTILHALGVRWDQIAQYDSQQLTPAVCQQYEWPARKIIAGLDAHRPWMMKDPRLCLTLPVWQQVLEIPICVCVYRAPIQIAQSLQAREHFSLQYGIALWEKYSLYMLKYTQNSPRVLVSYHELMRDPVPTVKKLYEDLSAAGVQALRLPADKEIQAFIEPTLFHKKGDNPLQNAYINQQQMALSEALSDAEALTWQTLPDLSAGAVEALEIYEAQLEALQQQQRQAEQLQTELTHLQTKFANQQAASVQVEQQLQQRIQQVNGQLHASEQAKADYQQRWQRSQQETHGVRRELTTLQHTMTHKQQTLMQTMDAKQEAITTQEAQIQKLKIDLQRQIETTKKLNYWVHALQHDIKLIFESLTWRIGDAIRIALLKLSFRAAGHTAKDHIERLIVDFQAWQGKQRTGAVAAPTQETRVPSSTPQSPPPKPMTEQLKSLVAPDNPRDYARWFSTYDTLSVDTLEQMQVCIERWDNPPLISILMPTYNSPEALLREAIESVQAQIYPNWQLCIADDASTQPHVRGILEEYQNRDTRITVTFREQNGHISAASNTALATATGEFIALLDHDDVLPQHALFWMVEAVLSHPEGMIWYSDEDKINEKGERFDPHFKPDWNPDLFLSYNLINHFALYRASLLREIDGFREGYEGSQDYDLALRAIEKIDATQIHHIPRVLYHWRAISGSTAVDGNEKPYALLAAHKAIGEYLAKRGIQATVSEAPELSGANRVRYHLPADPPRVSLVIPTYNGFDILSVCVESILTKTDYPNYEIVIVDNNTDDAETLDYLEMLEREGKARVLKHPYPFNYSEINNTAIKQLDSELVGLLNNDIEVINEDWLSEMVSHALRPEVGGVGARLWYPNETLQHGGVITGLGGAAGHSHKYFPRGDVGYFGRVGVVQNYSAVTAACLVMRRSVFDEVGGLDAENLTIAFNDVDFCLRIGEAGYRIVWTPYADLYHHESISRGHEDTPAKQARFTQEINYMKARWGQRLLQDPAYSPNLTLDSEDFAYAWGPRVPEVSELLTKRYPPRQPEPVSSTPLSAGSMSSQAMQPATATPVARLASSSQIAVTPSLASVAEAQPVVAAKPVAAPVIPSTSNFPTTQANPTRPQHQASHFTLPPHVAHRAAGFDLLQGHGLEIGAFNQPAVLSAQCTVEYADVHAPEAALDAFPEIQLDQLVTVDHVIDLDTEGLSLFDSASFDFVICNHVLEHIANPIKILGELFRVTKPQGYVVIGIPDKRFTSDNNRLLTSLSHLLLEYKENVTAVTDEHYVEFLQNVHPEVYEAVHDNELQPHLDNIRRRREHAHVWDSESFILFMQQALMTLNLSATCVFQSHGDSNEFEYFAVWQRQ